MPTIIVLGTGTAIGKTFVSCALARALAQARPEKPVFAFKPIESGTHPAPGPTSDAYQLALASHSPIPPASQPYAFPEPLSPHLAARRAGCVVEIETVKSWIERAKQCALYANSYMALSRHPTPSIVTPCTDMHYTANTVQSTEQNSSAGLRSSSSQPMSDPTILIETAGAVFSPLSPNLTNFDLASAFPDALWLLVAPDRLGTLHDVTTTLFMMKHRGKLPDFVVLSQPDPTDPSINTNAAELATLKITDVSATVPHRGEIPQNLVVAMVAALNRAST